MTIQTSSKIIAVVSNVIRLKRDTLGSDLLSELRQSLTRENPAYHQMKRMRDRQPYRLAHMKLPAATITNVEEDDTTLYIPRGYRTNLINIAKSYGKEVQFFDETIAFERDNEMSLNGVELTDYQRKGMSKLVFQREGILVAPCGGGKTVTGIAVITTLKQPTIVLVHTTELLTQWQRELALKAIIPGGVGQWGVGTKSRAQVTVATIQTLIRMPPHELRTLLDNFGCVVLDEAHHCPADTFMGVMNLCSARYRYGLTATPNRKDALDFLMTDTIGPILAEISDSELQAEGRSQSCTVRNVVTTFYSRYTADEWTNLLKAICSDRDRNNQITNNIVRTWNEGHFSLVLSDRVAHCQELASKVREHGLNVELLIGAVPKYQRDQIIERAKQNLIDVIIATKVADEGLDIPNLSCIHLTTPTANEAKTQQRIGRIRRPMEGKKSLVVDYIDARVTACLRMAKARKTMYRKWGFTDEQ